MGLLRIFLLGFAAMASSVQGYDAGWVLLLLQPPTSVLPTTLCLITQVVGVALHFTKLVLSLFLIEGNTHLFICQKVSIFMYTF